MKHLGIVTGMQSESACLSAFNSSANNLNNTFCAGGNLGRARIGAENLINKGANALLSFGIAGALDPSLHTGDIVMSSEVVDGSGTKYLSNTAWRNCLSPIIADFCRLTEGPIISLEQPVTSPVDKLKIFNRLGAIAVDMESAGVATAASQHKLPFLAIRAIADLANQSLPSSALIGLAPNGNARPFAVISSLLSQPWEIFSLAQITRNTSYAFSSLRRIGTIQF